MIQNQKQSNYQTNARLAATTLRGCIISTLAGRLFYEVEK